MGTTRTHKKKSIFRRQTQREKKKQTMFIYLLWMDVGFYLEVQQLPVRVSSNTSDPGAVFVYSPFGPITVKLMMVSATIQFIDEPLAYLTVCYTRVADYFSPNSVSLIGVLVAAIAAKFFAKEELKYRQFG